VPCVGCKVVLFVWHDQRRISEDRSSQSWPIYIRHEISAIAVANYTSLHTC